PAPDSSFIRDP
uniref:Extended FMRFamide-10 n=1 Tax=Lobatophasma redelinghuysense TaxID=253128 RepID=FAR10_LOBRE|nr:RecName: Full=Extended FMRFamide-10; Short=FMRFa-10 [Lobatophasma redelinghuysense]